MSSLPPNSTQTNRVPEEKSIRESFPPLVDKFQWRKPSPRDDKILPQQRRMAAHCAVTRADSLRSLIPIIKGVPHPQMLTVFTS